MDERRLMPQRLQQAADSVAMLGRAKENRANLPALEFENEVREHLVAARHDIAQELLHEVVVIIGELFEHREALIRLELREAGRNGDHFARRMLAIDIGP